MARALRSCSPPYPPCVVSFPPPLLAKTPPCRPLGWGPKEARKGPRSLSARSGGGVGKALKGCAGRREETRGASRRCLALSLSNAPPSLVAPPRACPARRARPPAGFCAGARARPPGRGRKGTPGGAAGPGEGKRRREGGSCVCVERTARCLSRSLHAPLPLSLFNKRLTSTDSTPSSGPMTIIIRSSVVIVSKRGGGESERA